MPLIETQMRFRELGRIRIGQQVPSGNGRTSARAGQNQKLVPRRCARIQPRRLRRASVMPSSAGNSSASRVSTALRQPKSAFTAATHSA